MILRTWASYTFSLKNAQDTIEAFKRPAVRLLDAQNTELATYEIAQAKNYQAVIMCALELVDEHWLITEWGVGSEGNIRNYASIQTTITEKILALQL